MANTYHLQLLRGVTSKTQSYTGLEGELVYDTQGKNLFIHDGATTGGMQIARMTNIPTKVSQLENDLNFVSTAAGSSSADSAIHDQNGNVIHQYYAPINNPTFNGIVTVPTPAVDDNSTTAVNSAWVATATSVVHTFGNETINGTKTFNSTINGTAIRANWGDLAEMYRADQQYPAGTLIMFGGEKEVTIATTTVNGVVSDKPGYLLNSQLEDGIPIALAGRVHVRVDCHVNKFDKLVLSSTPGVATVDNQSTNPIARALEDGDQLVLAATMFRL